MTMSSFAERVFKRKHVLWWEETTRLLEYVWVTLTVRKKAIDNTHFYFHVMAGIVINDAMSGILVLFLVGIIIMRRNGDLSKKGRGIETHDTFMLERRGESISLLTRLTRHPLFPVKEMRVKRMAIAFEFKWIRSMCLSVHRQDRSIILSLLWHKHIQLTTWSNWRLGFAFPFSHNVWGKRILFIISRNEYTGICADAIVAKMNAYVSQSFLIQLQTFRAKLECVKL